MSTSDTREAKRYASIAEVAAAQCKMYTEDARKAPEYTDLAKGYAEIAEAAASSASESAQIAFESVSSSSQNALNAQEYADSAAQSQQSAEQSSLSAQDSATHAADSAQQALGTVSKTLRVSDNDVNPLPVAADRANKVLTFDENGDPVTTVPASGSAEDVLNELAKSSGASLVGYGEGTLEDVAGDVGNKISGNINFSIGGQIQSNKDYVFFATDKSWYYWNGAFPKLVPSSSSPSTTGGIGNDAWLPLGESSLRTDLATGGKASLVGYGDTTVEGALDSLFNSVLYYSQFGTLQALQAHIVSNNLKRVDIVFDEVVTFGPGSGGLGTIVTLSDMDYLGVRGLVIRDTLLYSGSFDITRVFDLKNISNLYFEVDASSTLEYVGDDKRGLTPLRLDGCGNMSYVGKTNKCYQGYEIKNVDTLTVRSTNLDTRYPNSLKNIGLVDIKSKNNGCRRDFFLTDNCGGGVIDIDAVDTQQGTPIKMYFFNGNMDNQVSNLYIRYKYRSTGRYTLPYRVAPIWLDWGWDSTTTEPLIAGLMRNITIEYDVVGGTWGSVVSTTKLVNETSGDMTPRGYTYSNIVIKGRIELGGGDALNQAFAFNYNDGNNWVAGDNITNFCLRDLVVRKLNGGTLYLNANQLIGAVNSPNQIVIDNVSSPEMTLNSSSYGDKVFFRNCYLKDYTTINAVPNAYQSLSSTVLINKLSSDASSFTIGTMSSYRTICMLEITIRATSPASASTNNWGGVITGQLQQGTTPSTPTLSGATTKYYGAGVSMTPSVRCETDGRIILTLAGWESLEAFVAVDVDMSYIEYSGGSYKTPKGLVSTKFTIAS